MEVIVQAGIMAAPASSVIYSKGGTESFKLKEMIMLQKQKEKKNHQKPDCASLASHLHFAF